MERVYTFGLKHKGYNFVVQNQNSTASTFKFQGEELEEDLGKNVYAYQWRDYDPAIGRFNKIDRFAEKYYTVSPYVFTGNNPILYREIAGDSIGKGKEHFEKIKGIATDARQSILDSRTKKLDKAKGNDKRTERLNKRFAKEDANPNSQISRLNQTLTEFDALESSDTVFNLITNSPDVDGETANGNIQYDTSNGEININLNRGFDAGFFGHELKHGFQFLDGKLSFFKSSGNGGFLYDLQDEVEAYKRQSLFGGQGRSLAEIKSAYPGISDRTKQRTLSSPTVDGVPNAPTYGVQISRMKGSALEQVYIKN